MPDLVDTKALHHAVDQLAHAVEAMAAHAGDNRAVRRLQNDVERIRLDAEDCRLLPEVAPVRTLEVIPDTPYDESMWEGVDDEGLGGFRVPHQTQARPHHRR